MGDVAATPRGCQAVREPGVDHIPGSHGEFLWNAAKQRVVLRTSTSTKLIIYCCYDYDLLCRFWGGWCCARIHENADVCKVVCTVARTSLVGQCTVAFQELILGMVPRLSQTSTRIFKSPHAYQLRAQTGPNVSSQTERF